MNVKKISKYLSKNINFLPKILVFLKNPSIKIVESAMKISEILMNGLVPINNIYEIIIDIYNFKVKEN